MLSAGTILLLDENKRQQEGLSVFLLENHFEIVKLDRSAKLEAQLLSTSIDIIVVSVNFFNEEGVQLIKLLKTSPFFKDIFIVMLSQKIEDETQVIALESGADAFWVQPMAQWVMLRRIKALMRRKKQKSPRLTKELYIDYDRYLIIKDNREIFLPKKEFQLLSLLYSKPKKVFSREEIKSFLWNNSDSVKTRTIDVHIRKIREKVGEDAITTVQGIGYKLEIA
jgi:two-component system alkaline phosphatase synthesis response regulator PhoP